MCEKCAELIDTLNQNIIRAIESNKETFMALMEKIRDEAGGDFMTATTPNHDPDPEEEMTLSNLMLGTYLIGWWSEQLRNPDVVEAFPDAMTSVCAKAVDDGHIYASYQQARRH